MEGLCVIDRDFPIFVMYKEIFKNKILILIYQNYNVDYNIISCKQLTYLLQIDCINILNKLQYYDDIQLTFKIWQFKNLKTLNYLYLK